MSPDQATTITPGTLFIGEVDDLKMVFEVLMPHGNLSMRCEAVDTLRTERGPRESDRLGTVRTFSNEYVAAHVARRPTWLAMLEADKWLQAREVGDIVHYANGVGSFVRCEIVIGTPENVGGIEPNENIGQKILQPVALVGSWGERQLPHFGADGSLQTGYHASKVINQNGAWIPSMSCVYEAPSCAPQLKQTDPRQMEALDLTPEPLSQDQLTQAEKWQQVNAIRAAVEHGAGTDPDEILRSVSEHLDSSPGH